MGRKPLNRVRCPRCNKVGTLRLKGGTSVVVSHYDPVKAKQRRGKGMRHHYVGSLRLNVDKILEPYQARLSEPYLMALKVVLKRLQTSLVKKPADYKVIEYDEQLSKVLLALNELRVIKQSQKVADHKVEWSMRCMTCRQPYEMHARFTGLRDSGGLKVYYNRKPEITGTDAAIRQR